jgi:hypothetical protein
MGSAVTQLALPLTAVVVLQASTFQVGLLTSAATAAFALIALPAGALVDRWAKRRLMIWCDVARMVIIGSVPVAAALHVLTLGQLYAVAVTAGVGVLLPAPPPAPARRHELVRFRVCWPARSAPHAPGAPQHSCSLAPARPATLKLTGTMSHRSGQDRNNVTSLRLRPMAPGDW